MLPTSEVRQSQHFDVAVIGGGAAGLTAAATLGRARRSVVVIDSGAPRNAPSAGVHLFLTRDGISPADFVAIGGREVEHYGGLIVAGEAVSACRVKTGFGLTLRDGRKFTARRLLVTTGLIDELPEVPGVRELWGRDVHHCPYCHGWELDGRTVGVLGSGPRAVHQALMFRQWVTDLVLFLHTAPEPTDEEAEQLAAFGIRVVSGRVDSLQIDDGHLTGVRLSDGTVVARQSLVVAPRFVARSDVLHSLGLHTIEHPLGIGEFITADATGLTAIPGVWVAGNVTDLSAGVVVAAASGMTAGAAVNTDLIAEDLEKAVAAHRKSQLTATGSARGGGTHDHDPQVMADMVTKEFWDDRYGSPDAVWSGNPNPRLVEQVADLAPGTALDVGSGEGADAIWLARRGWRVTGIDISTVGLARAAERAADAGPQIADRINWQQADLLSWDEAGANESAGHRFDLVSAQFMHVPRPAMESVHRALATAVLPGGTLLIVGHHPADLETSMNRPSFHEMFYTAEEIAATLDPDEWQVLVASAPQRQARDPEGRLVTIQDAVLKAVRR